MRYLIVFAAAMLVAAACAMPSLADETSTPGPVATPKSLDWIVVTAQRHATPLSATSRHTFILTSTELEQVGAATAADALRFLPGMVVQQYGSFGSLQTAALRGASSLQTLVLIDGRPVNEGDTGNFDFTSLPASMIDRIEVVEGGSSTLYGSAAMGGVINILTRGATAPGNVNAFAQLGYRGSFVRGLGFTLGEPDLLARVDTQAAFADNRFNYPAFAGLEPSGTRTNDDAKLQDTALTLAAKFGQVAAIVKLADDTSAIGAPGTVAFASLLARQQRVYRRANLDIKVPLPRGEVALQLHSDGKRLHFYDTTEPFAYDTQDNGNTRGAAVRATFAAGKVHTITLGFDNRSDMATFEATFEGFPPSAPTTARAATLAWYLQDELHAPSAPLTVSLGLRNERVQGTKPVTVPSVGALARVSEWLDMLANYGRAFRAPNLDERYFPNFGDPKLEPEYGATFDAGLRARLSRGQASVAYFGQDTNNLIINVTDAFGNFMPKNVSRARVRGIEASAQTGVGSIGHVLFSYTNFLRATDLTPGFSGNRLYYRPSAIASLSAWIYRAGWDYGIDERFVGRRFADEANTALMPPYAVSGVHVKRNFSRRRLALTLRVDNLENNHHAEEQLGYPVVGSALSLRLSTR